MVRSRPAHFPYAELRLSQTLRRLTVWCLLLALPVYGFSSTLVELLGPTHSHRAVASVATPGVGPLMEGWVDVRRVGGVSATSVRHTHSHNAFQRHHHDPFDPTVIAMDGDADGSNASGPSGSAALVLGLPGSIRIAPPSVAELAWLMPAASAFTSLPSSPLERPPRVG